MRLERAVRVLRIFDQAKAEEFYLDYLGFVTDWEDRFGPDFPRLATYTTETGAAERDKTQHSRTRQRRSWRRTSLANSTVERRTDSNSSDTSRVSTIANGRVVATAPRPYSMCHEPGWMVIPRA